LVDCETFLERCNWVPPDNSSCITIVSGNYSGQRCCITWRGSYIPDSWPNWNGWIRSESFLHQLESMHI